MMDIWFINLSISRKIPYLCEKNDYYAVTNYNSNLRLKANCINFFFGHNISTLRNINVCEESPPYVHQSINLYLSQ